MDINGKRDLIRMWEETGKGHYTTDDIPDWVRKSIGHYGANNALDWSADFYRPLLANGKRNSIFRIGETIHFNRDGYELIISHAENREYMSGKDISRWRMESLT